MASFSISLVEKLSTDIRTHVRSVANIAKAEIPIRLNINIMYQSSFACLFFMALFSLKSLADFVSVNINIMQGTPALDVIALRLFDVVILQVLSILVVGFVALRSLRLQGAAWASKLHRVVYPIAFICLMLSIEVILERFVLKPTFGFNRPGNSIGEPWLTSFLRHFYDFEHTKGSSTPSGFIVRQTMLAILFVLLIHQPKFLTSGRTWKLPVLHLANILILLFVGWLRLYTGTHRLYDVAIGIGIGGFVFWAMIFIFFSFKEEVRSQIGDFALPALTFAFMILLYSQDFVRWISFCAVVIATLSALFHPFSSVASCRQNK